MRRAATIAALITTLAAAADDLVIAEHGSVGIDPGTKFSYVTRYSPDLQFLGTALSYPLTSGSPSAALAVADVMFVAEGNCIASACAPRLARYDPLRGREPFGPVLHGRAKSIDLSRRRELVVTTTEEIVRLDFFTGETLASFPLIGPAGSSVTDGDVDSSGCTAAVAFLPSAVSLFDICGAELVTRQTIVYPGFEGVGGVRFTPGDDLLVTGRVLRRYDRAGALVQTYETGGGCRLDVTRSGTEAVLACGLDLIRLDLLSGIASQPMRLQRGLWADSIAFVVAPPPEAPRRRSVGH